jgi:putative spermidine/putrescine transport system permease protein
LKIDLGNFALGVYAVLILLFLLFPVFVIISISFSTANYISFPPVGFTLKWYGEINQYPDFIRGITISLFIAIVTVISSLVIGILASLALVRHKFPGRDVLNAIFSSPLVLPSIILGLALVQFFAQIIRVNTLEAIIIGTVILATPFAIRLISASLVGLDKSLEEASMNLGASPIRTFWKITVPIIKPGLISAAFFTFLISFDNLTIAIFLSSPLVKPLPVILFSALSQRIVDPTLTAIASLLAIGTLLIGLLLGKYVKVFSIVSR